MKDFETSWLCLLFNISIECVSYELRNSTFFLLITVVKNNSLKQWLVHIQNEPSSIAIGDNQ